MCDCVSVFEFMGIVFYDDLNIVYRAYCFEVGDPFPIEDELAATLRTENRGKGGKILR